jgi:predicted nucleic acid-binding Zn finger protein
MTHSNIFVHSSFVLPVLQHVSIDRLQKAVTTLAEDSVTITLTRQTETEIRALVQNGTGKEYGVTLTDAGAFCSCPDALYRGVTCKHATLLALSALRTPQAKPEEQPHETPPKPNLKLAPVRAGFCG